MTLMPCITVPGKPPIDMPIEDPLAALVDLVRVLQESEASGRREVIGDVLAAVVAEGRAFRESEAGRHWKALLENAGVAKNGWMLWNMLDVDRLIADVDLPNDKPSDMLETLMRQIGTSQLSELVSLVSDLSIEASLHANI
jgi:hypothetical protein